MPTAPITPMLRNWYAVEDCRVADLAALVATPTDLADYPSAVAVEQGVLVYDSARIRPVLGDEQARRTVMAELAQALDSGPGVLVLAGAFDDLDVVDAVTAAFNEIGADERAAGSGAGDHFAQAGANMRIWNALEKLAMRDPMAFVRYYANAMIALVCEAWLGPNYQMTSQVNQVNPGGAAQRPHRDYHLGFQSVVNAGKYPIHTHDLSAVLTLQGAVAHSDMPLPSGPTLFLPHSQKYGPGYLAWQIPEFVDLFADAHVQLPLRKGDAVFFNPALFHAAGENTSIDIYRMANLLQVSSAFGRAMESVDRERISVAVYPALLDLKRAGTPMASLHHAIAACAEGYAFPTNLDRDQPQGSAAPPSQADLVRQALDEEWESDALADELAAHAIKRASA